MRFIFASLVDSINHSAVIILENHYKSNRQLTYATFPAVLTDWKLGAKFWLVYVVECSRNRPIITKGVVHNQPTDRKWKPSRANGVKRGKTCKGQMVLGWSRLTRKEACLFWLHGYNKSLQLGIVSRKRNAKPKARHDMFQVFLNRLEISALPAITDGHFQIVLIRLHLLPTGYRDCQTDESLHQSNCETAEIKLPEPSIGSFRLLASL